MFSINFNRKLHMSPAKSVAKLSTTRSSNLLLTDKTRLYNLPKIPSYYKIDRPSLSPTMKRNIEEKLALDKSAEIALKKRQKSKDFFLNYKKNPFMNTTQLANFEITRQNRQNRVESSKSHSIFHPNRDRMNQTIVQAINSLRGKSPVQKDLSLKNIKKQASNRSTNMIKQIKTMGYTKKHQPKDYSQNFFKFKSQAMDFEKIIVIEEDNFYLKHQASINIFACVKSLPNILNNNILSKHYFSFTSVIQKAEQNIRFPIYRDISRKSRKTSLKNKFSKLQLMEFISSSDINTNSKRIRFEDMLGIASGRCTSELISDWIYSKDKNFKYDSMGKDEAIFFKENTQNHNANVYADQENLMEVTQWKNNKSPEQMNHSQKCDKFKNNIVRKMDEKVKLSKKTIQDTNAHKFLTQQIKRDILYFLKMNQTSKTSVKLKKQFGEPSPKLTETKARTIKNNQLVQTMKIIKKKFDNMEQLGSKTMRI